MSYLVTAPRSLCGLPTVLEHIFLLIPPELFLDAPLSLFCKQLSSDIKTTSNVYLLKVQIVHFLRNLLLYFYKILNQ